MADVAVGGVDVVPADFVTDSQMVVFGGFLYFFRRPYQVGVDDRRRWVILWCQKFAEEEMKQSVQRHIYPDS